MRALRWFSVFAAGAAFGLAAAVVVGLWVWAREASCGNRD